MKKKFSIFISISNKYFSIEKFTFSRYSWCSESLVCDKFRWSSDVQLEDLIPLEASKGPDENGSGEKRLVIGHNVAFDRSFVKEQYYVKVTHLSMASDW